MWDFTSQNSTSHNISHKRREACVGEEAEARNLAFFRVKWLQPATKGTPSDATKHIVMAASRFLAAAAVCAILVTTSIFCSWESWIVLGWLHQGYDKVLSTDFLYLGIGMRWWFSFKNSFWKVFQNCLFCCCGAEIHPVLELQFLAPFRVCIASQALQITL